MKNMIFFLNFRLTKMSRSAKTRGKPPLEQVVIGRDDARVNERRRKSTRFDDSRRKHASNDESRRDPTIRD